MRGFIKATASIFGVVAVVGGMTFGGQYLDLWSTGFFQPRYEQIRNNTFHNSQSYNDGMVRDLENLRLEYMQSTDDQKVTLRGIVLHRFSVYPIDKMPSDLQSFYLSLRG